MKRFLKSIAGKVGGAVMLASAFGASALAQSKDVPLNQGTIEAVPILKGDWSTVLQNVVNFILIIAGVAAVAYLIYGGFLYITASGDAEKAGKGRVAITNAIIGVIIIMASFAIYNFVINVGG